MNPISDYKLTRRIFLRLLGLVYLVAFVSLWTQLDGLIGSHGILPAADLMKAAAERIPGRYDLLPTLAWISASDRFLHLLCAGGVVFSIALMAGLVQPLALFLLWLFYLSLVTVSRDFFNFQWDVLLLEAGFLAIFFAPFRIFSRLSKDPPPPTIVLWLFRWLLFRLMFESGTVKLVSGDFAWRTLTALNFHYETQPLPTWIGWYSHQLPAWFQKFSCGVMFGIEIAAPFLIFTTRRLRVIACVALISLQTLIALTGNYCFFNLLTILLCLLLLDDKMLNRVLTVPLSRIRKERPHVKSKEEFLVTPCTCLLGLVAVVVLVVSGVQLSGFFFPRGELPAPLVEVLRVAGPFRSVNRYGLFAVMTTERREIVVEGSNDAAHWTAYEFKYKPGDPARRPAFVAPHQPRLDWQMWFAALGSCEQNPWFQDFMIRLLEGRKEVEDLLAFNPFPDRPPKFIRSGLFDYQFTSISEKWESGRWWSREMKGVYCPVKSHFQAGTTLTDTPSLR